MKKICVNLVVGVLLSALVCFAGRRILELQYGGIPSELVRFCYMNRDMEIVRYVAIALLGLTLGKVTLQVMGLIALRSLKSEKQKPESES